MGRAAAPGADCGNSLRNFEVMESETLYERLCKLLQKSRKALRLYSSAGRSNAGHPSYDREHELQDLLVDEWREMNAVLIQKLSGLLEHKSRRDLIAPVTQLRDFFYEQWRGSEADLNRKQRELIVQSENGDFVRAAGLAKDLAVLKARVQAAQAAHHEFNEVMKRSKVPQSTILLSDEHVVEEPNFHGDLGRYGNVIPLRRAQR